MFCTAQWIISLKFLAENIENYISSKQKRFQSGRELKPSLSIKILYVNNFTTKLNSKLISDLYIGVHLKGTKKFGSKVVT